jgi:hypothetical protein
MNKINTYDNMYRYLEPRIVQELCRDLTHGIINRRLIETEFFRWWFELTDWTPFCDNVWKYDNRCRMFVRDGVILSFMCDDDGCVNKVSIGNLAVEWKTIWSK